MGLNFDKLWKILHHIEESRLKDKSIKAKDS